MLLHLAEDEKFIDHILDMFETVAPGENRYFVEIPRDGKPPKYFKNYTHPAVTLATAESECLQQLIQNIESFDGVIFHNLYNPYKQEFLRKLPSQIYVHWMCWGADLYCIPELRKRILTTEKKRSKKTFGKACGDLIRKVSPGLWYTLYLKPRNLPYYSAPAKKTVNVEEGSGDQRYKSLFDKVNSASTVVPSEIDAICKYLNPKIQYIPYRYTTIEEITCGSDAIVSGNNVLVGNSATPTNNHFEVLESLKGAKPEGQKIIVPLSYGDPVYAEKVIESYKVEFGERFKPLTSFLSLEQYNKILNSCGTVIMNHVRQQAMGNIILALWMGAAVYLNKKSPVFKFLTKEGIMVYKLSSKNFRCSGHDHDLLAKINRPRISKLYARTAVLKQTEAMVEKIMKKQTIASH